MLYDELLLLFMRLQLLYSFCCFVFFKLFSKAEEEFLFFYSIARLQSDFLSPEYRPEYH